MTAANKRSLRSRFLRAILPVVIFLGVLEGALWLASVFVGQDLATELTGDVNILCVGDSHTYGLGVHESQSYPAQLRRRLAYLPDTSIAVSNKGVPSYNSAQLLEKLPVWLARQKPDIVFLLIGINNAWNTEPYSLSQKLLGWSRTYKLVRILAAGDTDKFEVELEEGGLVAIDGGETQALGKHEGSRKGAREGDRLRELTVDHVTRLVASIRQGGARPYLLTYASEANAIFKTINAAIREVATAEGTPLIDQAMLFREPIARDGYEAYIFPPDDNHPNARGYSLYVDHILKALQVDGVIAALPPRYDPDATPHADMSVNAEALSSEDKPTVRLKGQPGLGYQFFVVPEKDEAHPKHGSLLQLCKQTPQFNRFLDESGSAEFTVPQQFRDRSGKDHLWGRAMVFDENDEKAFAISDWVEIRF